MNEVRKIQGKTLKFPPYIFWAFLFICFLPLILSLLGISFVRPSLELLGETIIQEKSKWIDLILSEMLSTTLIVSVSVIGVLIGIVAYAIWLMRKDFLVNIIAIALGVGSIMFIVAYLHGFIYGVDDPTTSKIETFHSYLRFYLFLVESYVGLLLMIGGSLYYFMRPGLKNLRYIYIYNAISLCIIVLFIIFCNTQVWNEVNLGPKWGIVIHRPLYLIPLCLIALNIPLYWLIHQKKPSLISHALFIALFPLSFMEFYFAIGAQFYDLFTLSALLIELTAYLLVFVALVFDCVSTYKWHGEFVYILSHGVRTPLHVIFGVSECLKNGIDGQLSEAQISSLNQIDGSSEKIMLLLNDMIDISAIEANKIALYETKVNLKEIVEKCYQLYLPKAQEKGLKTKLRLPKEDIIMKGDPSKIEHIIRNFITNAIKFTDEGAVLVELKTKRDEIRFSVQDTGYGLTKQELREIFRPFSAAATALTLERMGTGVGLTLSNHFAELHLGKIDVKSKKGEGSDFTLLLPYS